MMFESHEKFKQQQLINNITISGVAPFVDEDFLSLVMAIREKLERRLPRTKFIQSIVYMEAKST